MARLCTRTGVPLDSVIFYKHYRIRLKGRQEWFLGFIHSIMSPRRGVPLNLEWEGITGVRSRLSISWIQSIQHVNPEEIGITETKDIVCNRHYKILTDSIPGDGWTYGAFLGKLKGELYWISDDDTEVKIPVNKIHEIWEVGTDGC